MKTKRLGRQHQQGSSYGPFASLSQLASCLCAVLFFTVLAQAAPEINVESPAGTALGTNSVVGFGGSNTYGERTIPAGLTSVQAVAAGAFHSIALRAKILASRAGSGA